MSTRVLLALAGVLLAACSSAEASRPGYGPLSAEAQSSTPCTLDCQKLGKTGVFSPGRGPGEATCTCVDPVRAAPVASASATP